MGISRILWIVLSVGLCAPVFVRAQCNYQAYLDSCKTYITNDHFNYLKEYEIDNEFGAKQKVEYSIALVDGFDYQYYFNGFKQGHHQEIIATLYDSKRQKLTSNNHDKKFIQVIKHNCQKTGIYYITFTFMDDQEYCGAAVLGFVKHSAER